MNIYSEELTNLAIRQFEPQQKFKKQEALVTNIYDTPDMWFSGPAKYSDNPTRWQPDGAPAIVNKGPAAIFFVHPTSYIGREYWNVPLNDADSQARARLFLRGLSSPFAASGEIWAPRYRQASIGAFLTTKPEGKAALNAAYQDVLLAFDRFVAKQQKDRPIIIAGHSQGALHLTHLLKDRIARKPLARRIVAVYIVGWPISETTDLSAMGLSVCSSPDQTGCIMSWESYAEPANYDQVLKAYGSTTGFDGTPRAGSKIVCTNPLNGGAAIDAAAEANLGTLNPNNDLSKGELVPATISARCDDKGFLLIGDPPKIGGGYVLPGNNYHVYDYPLFWANVRADALWRLQRFLAK
jgi:hypothetical protein